MNTSPILNAAIQFINLEADLLDQGEFREWLALWRAEGMYIIPIDQQTTDFANVLNYAYDNHEMREKRVQRLYSGESISTTPRARTIRMSGRYRLLSAS
ncbi:aromatic-ring-hydroxylating dioxygenase subunit beta, partial [Klebsiella aerogenes]